MSRECCLVEGQAVKSLTVEQEAVIKVLLDEYPVRLSMKDLITKSGHEDAPKILTRLRDSQRSTWGKVICMSGPTKQGYGLCFHEENPESPSVPISEND